jgi:hypothetical protein
MITIAWYWAVLGLGIAFLLGVAVLFILLALARGT